jgi:phosphatidylglycerol:prolipoprotein diacylglycerol transferase
MIGSIVMARVFDVFIYNLPQYINNFSDAFKIWNGGLSIQGGLLGAIIITLIFCKKYKTRFYDVADITVIPLAFTMFLGKLANYTNSELYGTITNPQATPWCVVFQKVDMYCRHPTQIYEAITILLMFGILLFYYTYYLKNNTNKKSNWQGTTFWLFMLIYGLLRFFITFLRDEPRYGGLNVGQWLSIIMVIVAGVFLWRIWRKEFRHKR